MAAPSMRVVTISSTYGAGGTVVGPVVAQRLGVPYLDRILSSKVTTDAALGTDDEVQLTEDERSEGMLRRVLDSLASVPAFFGTVITPLDEAALGEHPVWERVEASIVKMADETGGVVVGRGATCVLRDHAGAFHVRLDGPSSRRVEQAMAIEGIGSDEARKRQATIDRTRASYVKRFYDADSNDPSLYHLVLDSTALPLNACVDLVVDAARAFWSR